MSKQFLSYDICREILASAFVQIKSMAGSALGGTKPNNPDQEGAQGQGNQFMHMAQDALGGSHQVQQLTAHRLLFTATINILA